MEAAVSTWLHSVTTIQAELDGLRGEETDLNHTLQISQIRALCAAEIEARARGGECLATAEKIKLSLKRTRLLAEFDALSHTVATISAAKRLPSPDGGTFAESDAALSALAYITKEVEDTRSRLKAAREAQIEATTALEAQASVLGLLEARAATARLRSAADLHAAASDQVIIDGYTLRMTDLLSRIDKLRQKRKETLEAGTIAEEDTKRFQDQLEARQVPKEPSPPVP